MAPKLSLVGPLIRHELNASVSHSLQHAALYHLDSCGARTKVMDQGQLQLIFPLTVGEGQSQTLSADQRIRSRYLSSDLFASTNHVYS